jgi:hypothetical protein
MGCARYRCFPFYFLSRSLPSVKSGSGQAFLASVTARGLSAFAPEADQFVAEGTQPMANLTSPLEVVQMEE